MTRFGFLQPPVPEIVPANRGAVPNSGKLNVSCILPFRDRGGTLKENKATHVTNVT